MTNPGKRKFSRRHRGTKTKARIVEHIRARAGTWDGDISSEELLRKTRRPKFTD